MVSCQRLGVEPWAYLQDVLTRLPTALAGQLGDMLPDHWQAARQANTVTPLLPRTTFWLMDEEAHTELNIIIEGLPPGDRHLPPFPWVYPAGATTAGQRTAFGSHAATVKECHFQA